MILFCKEAKLIGIECGPSCIVLVCVSQMIVCLQSRARSSVWTITAFSLSISGNFCSCMEGPSHIAKVL